MVWINTRSSTHLHNVPSGVVSVEAQVHAPVAARVRIGSRRRVAAGPERAPVAVNVLVLALGGGVGFGVGDVDAAEAEAVALEDGVGLAPPIIFGLIE